jgi:tetratricopeptide (TPR) repeat protein
LSDYAMLADALDLPERDDVDVGNKARAVTRWLDHSPGWLLVLDDAPDADAVRALIPPRGGAVLITSRDRAGWAGFATALDVVELTPAEVRTYLEQHGRDKDPAASEQLVAALGGLPLTLADAVAYMNETGVPMAEYAAEYREHGGVVELSLDRVPDAGRELLRLCAFLVPDAIPLDLFTNHRAQLPRALADAGARAAHVCHRYSLLERQGNRLHMHWLVQQRVRDLMREDERRHAAATVTMLLDEEFPKHIDSIADPGTWMHCAELLPHVLELARTAEAEDARRATLLMHAGSFLERRGLLDEACEVLEDTLGLAERVYGPDDVHTAWVLNALGFALSARRRAENALAAHERALEIYERADPPYERTHIDVIRTRNNVGRCLHATGAVDAAAASLRGTLADAKGALDAGDLEIASIQNNFGSVLRDLGDLAGAREQHEAALLIKQAGGSARDVATTLYDLGRVLYDMNELDQALDRFAAAVEIMERTLPDDHRQLAEARVRLGLACRRVGRTAEGNAELERGRSVLARMSVSADPVVAEAVGVAHPAP